MTINTKHLRDLIRQACPLPWLLATSNSWRRIVVANRYHEVCWPAVIAVDNHPDLQFDGGAEGPNAQLLIDGVNAIPSLLDALDAQAAEIARLRDVLRWNAGALQACCSEGIREASNITIAAETKCFSEILDMADAALAQGQGENDANSDR